MSKIYCCLNNATWPSFVRTIIIIIIIIIIIVIFNEGAQLATAVFSGALINYLIQLLQFITLIDKIIIMIIIIIIINK